MTWKNLLAQTKGKPLRGNKTGGVESKRKERGRTCYHTKELGTSLVNLTKKREGVAVVSFVEDLKEKSP